MTWRERRRARKRHRAIKRQLRRRACHLAWQAINELRF